MQYTESPYWTVISNKTQTGDTTVCSSSVLLGGYKVTNNGANISRTYTDLMPHNAIDFTLKVWIEDVNTVQDLFALYFDGVLLNKYSYTASWPMTTTYLCGGVKPDYQGVRITGRIPHTSSSVTLFMRVFSDSTTTNTAFGIGFREVVLQLKNISTAITQQFCYFTAVTSASTSCLCADTKYAVPGSGCASCSSLCRTCLGPGADQCTSCVAGASFNGNTCYQCDATCAQCNGTGPTNCLRCATTKYWYQNGTCQNDCNYPLSIVSEADFKSCVTPCNSSQYLHQNRTCDDTCGAPFVKRFEGNVWYCDFPCASGDYLYPDGSCLASCPSPYTSLVDGEASVCLPCPSSQYLYADSTCSATCQTSYTARVDGYFLYCDASSASCSAPNYIYPNGSCLASCSLPYQGSTVSGVNYCSFSCTSGQYYYYSNGTCQGACSSPLIQNTDSAGNHYCSLPCLSGYYLYNNGTCLSSCVMNSVTDSNGVMYCKPPCLSGYYLYDNGTCQSDCPSPLTVDTSNSEYNKCKAPCLSGYYLYSNGTCASYCSMITQSDSNSVNYCKPPCVASQFLFDNGTCQNTCPSPMIIDSSNPEYNECKAPCQSGYYLYNNGTCASYCNMITQTDPNEVNYCKPPCSSSQFLYDNGTCQSTCSSPFTVDSSNSEYNKCKAPCNSGYYLYNNGTCASFCNMIAETDSNSVNYCKPLCPASQYFYDNSTCQTTCPFPFTIDSSNSEYNKCKAPCNSGYYLYTNGTCASYCNMITETDSNGIQYCKTPCPTGEYLYNNGTCASYCNMVTMTSPSGIQSCKPPCVASQFLFANGTCQSACPTPMITDSSNPEYSQCKAPCVSGYFLYNNGTCLSSCNMNSETDSNGVKYCKPPCGSSQFLYDNGTCQSTCSSPFTVDSSNSEYNKCKFPCGSGDFLYGNGTCAPICNMKIQTDSNNVKYCQPPCGPSQFLYDNNTCQATCPTPYLIDQNNPEFARCHPPCAVNQFYQTDLQSCSNNCPPLYSQIFSGLLTFCTPPSNSGSISSNTSNPTTANNTVVSPWVSKLESVSSGINYAGSIFRPNDYHSSFMVALAKLIKYIRFINVPIPAELRENFDSNNSVPYSFSTMFTFNMPQSVKDQFKSYPIPEVFASQGYHSSYLVNLWTSLSAYFILFMMGVLMVFIEKFIIKKFDNKYAHAFVRKTRSITQWNFFFLIVFNTYDDMLFFATLEFRTLHFDNVWSVVSFLICIGISIFAAYELYLVWKVSRESLKSKSTIMDVNGENQQKFFKKKWEKHQVLYAGYKDDSLLKQCCLFIQIWRILICYIFVCFLFEYPVVQTVFLTLTSVLMITYIVTQRPFKDNFSLFACMVYEILIFVVNICLLCLASLNATNSLDSGTQYRLGTAIVVCNLLVGNFANAFNYCYISLALWAGYKAAKQEGYMKKTTWMNATMSVYESPGMDFEEDVDEVKEKLTAKEETSTLDLQQRKSNISLLAEKAKKKAYRKIRPIGSMTSMTGEIELSKGSLVNLNETDHRMLREQSSFSNRFGSRMLNQQIFEKTSSLSIMEPETRKGHFLEETSKGALSPSTNMNDNNIGGFEYQASQAMLLDSRTRGQIVSNSIMSEDFTMKRNVSLEDNFWTEAELEINRNPSGRNRTAKLTPSSNKSSEYNQLRSINEMESKGSLADIGSLTNLNLTTTPKENQGESLREFDSFIPEIRGSQLVQFRRDKKKNNLQTIKEKADAEKRDSLNTQQTLPDLFEKPNIVFKRTRLSRKYTKSQDLFTSSPKSTFGPNHFDNYNNSYDTFSANNSPSSGSLPNGSPANSSERYSMKKRGSGISQSNGGGGFGRIKRKSIFSIAGSITLNNDGIGGIQKPKGGENV